ncbi:MAG: type II toxin-antitoxin system VapC family toxin [Tessaracoccus sp.]
MRRLFIDSNVPIYAIGGPSPHKAACLDVLQRAAGGEFELHASVEMVQEFLFHRMRRCDRAEAMAHARTLMAAVVLHEFGVEVLDKAIALVETHHMRGRDAVHAATALHHGLAEILTLDPEFDQCPDLRRINPGELRGTCGIS